MEPNENTSVRPTLLGVLGGRDYDPVTLREWATRCDLVFAADGGATSILEEGMAPDVVIGDFDSSTPEVRAMAKEVIFDPDQNTTDCDKLLGLARERGFSEMALIGVEGDRLDHVMATLQSVAKSGLHVKLILRGQVAEVLTGPVDVVRTTATGANISVLPLTRCHAVDLAGVVWPLEGADLSPVGANSISNRASAPEFRLRVTEGTVVCFYRP